MKTIARLMGTAGAVLLISACAAEQPSPDLNLVQAQPVREPAVTLPLPMPNPVKEEKIETDPQKILRNALKASRRSIVECSFEGARMICPWFDGHIYTMYLKAGETSTIYLSPDETMNDHSFRDEYFTSKTGAVGSPEGERDVIEVVGWMPGKRTKLTVLTNRREYQINLITQKTDYNPSMRFVYPEQTQTGIEAGLAAPPVRDVPVEPTTKIPLARLNLKYSASGKIGELTGEQLRVMDDGRKTYVIFPEGVQLRPPYFAHADGHANNVEMTSDESGNYIINGTYRSGQLEMGGSVITIKRGR